MSIRVKTLDAAVAEAKRFLEAASVVKHAAGFTELTKGDPWYRSGERITERHDSCTECEDAAATRLSAIRVQARRAYRRARYRVACGVGVNAGDKPPQVGLD